HNLLSRKREIPEELVDLLKATSFGLEELGDERGSISVGKGERLAQIPRQGSRHPGKNPALVLPDDETQCLIARIAKLVCPAHQRCISFDHRLDGEDQIVVSSIEPAEKPGDIERVPLRRM